MYTLAENFIDKFESGEEFTNMEAYCIITNKDAFVSVCRECSDKDRKYVYYEYVFSIGERFFMIPYYEEYGNTKNTHFGLDGEIIECVEKTQRITNKVYCNIENESQCLLSVEESQSLS